MNDWAVEQETFEELAEDALRDYLNVPLVGADETVYMLTSFERVSPHQVEYWLAGMSIPWRSNIHKLLDDVAQGYVRAQARGLHNREGNLT